MKRRAIALDADMTKMPRRANSRKAGRPNSKKLLLANNYYHRLTNANETDMNDAEADATPNKTAKPNTPQTRPIVITDDKCNADTLSRLLTEAKLKGKYFKKYTSIGTKISFAYDEDYQKFASLLETKSLEHYSHSSKETKTFKAVMEGLAKTEIVTIKAELEREYNIDTIRITDMNASRNTYFGLYLIEFSGATNLQSLQSVVKYIDHTSIKWRRYTPRNKGPTQCRRCGMYGHGQTNCHRKLVCLVCAKDHNLAECPFNKKDSVEPVPKTVYKCFSCVANKQKSSNHRADDPNCPSRLEYLEIRQRISARNNRKPPPRFTPQSFPPLSTKTQSNNSQPTRQQVSYADLMGSVESHTESHNLFSLEQLFEIFCKHVEQLQKCKSKMDQMKVIASLLKHAVQ